MRAARTVTLVLFILLSAIPGVAQGSGVPLSVYARWFDVTAKPDTPQSRLQWSHDPTFATQPLPKMRRFAVPFVMARRGQRVPAEDEDNVCYTVRSYLVARESRDSDVTLPVGYRTCTPSSKFGVKRADLPPQ
jgi:hypothetical protein